VGYIREVGWVLLVLGRLREAAATFSDAAFTPCEYLLLSWCAASKIQIPSEPRTSESHGCAPAWGPCRHCLC